MLRMKQVWLQPVLFVSLAILIITAVTIAATVIGPPKTQTLMSGAAQVTPAKCSAGSLYVATDKPLGQQIFVCGGGNAWFQLGSLGKSGGLTMTKGTLDINPAILPTLNSANKFAAEQYLHAGLSLLSPNPQPLCNATVRGTFWYLNNGNSQDSVQVCVYTGFTFAWTKLY